MFRYSYRILIATAALSITGGILAQPPRNPPPNRPVPRATAAAAQGRSPRIPSKFLAIPGLFPLSMTGVQSEIGLTAEQKRQLKAVSDGYVTSMQRLGNSFAQLSEDEKQSQAKDYSDQRAQLAHNAQRKAEAILEPQQLQAVEKIAFELSATGALADPGLQEKIGLSEEQRAKLTAVFERAGEKMQQLQRSTADEVMQLLDEDQSLALKKQINARKKRP